jgi:hypothetical protein
MHCQGFAGSERGASQSVHSQGVQKIAQDPVLLAGLRAAHARATARFWQLHGAPESLTIDVDATLIGSHSEKEGAAGNYKHGYGFHPLGAYADQTREPGKLSGRMARSGKAPCTTGR